MSWAEVTEYFCTTDVLEITEMIRDALRRGAAGADRPRPLPREGGGRASTGLRSSPTTVGWLLPQPPWSAPGL